MRPTTEQRVLGCLRGIATGDAIGKQTENLTREDVLRWYPRGVHGFEGPPGTPIPRYLGNKKHEWLIGESTDDTERTIAVARAILREADVRHTSVGRELLKCRKSVHPGVKSLWEFHEAGDPARVTERHDGCGAAIRVAPVGILYGPDRLEQIVVGAIEASIPTHGGVLAIAAAAATAAAISGAVGGQAPTAIMEFAQRAAEFAERKRSRAPAFRFSETLAAVYKDLAEWRELCPAEVAAKHFPNNPLTIVPLALALGTITNSAELAILLAANIGGDSDSVASIAGGILGARHPETVPARWHTVVQTVNGHDLAPIAHALAALRR